MVILPQNKDHCRPKRRPGSGRMMEEAGVLSRKMEVRERDRCWRGRWGFRTEAEVYGGATVLSTQKKKVIDSLTWERKTGFETCASLVHLTHF